MKMTAKCLIARIFPTPKPYAVAILAAGQVVRRPSPPPRPSAPAWRPRPSPRAANCWNAPPSPDGAQRSMNVLHNEIDGGKKQ